MRVVGGSRTGCYLLEVEEGVDAGVEFEAGGRGDGLD